MGVDDDKGKSELGKPKVFTVLASFVGPARSLLVPRFSQPTHYYRFNVSHH